MNKHSHRITSGRARAHSRSSRGGTRSCHRSQGRAQAAYPSKPVRVIVPYSAGGGADTLARTIFGKLSEKLGQQFIIDNRPGGGGTIGAAVVAKAPPDGYTILYDATAFSVNPTLFAKLAVRSRGRISSPCSSWACFRCCSSSIHR